MCVFACFSVCLLLPVGLPLVAPLCHPAVISKGQNALFENTTGRRSTLDARRGRVHTHTHGCSPFPVLPFLPFMNVLKLDNIQQWRRFSSKKRTRA